MKTTLLAALCTIPLSLSGLCQNRPAAAASQHPFVLEPAEHTVTSLIDKVADYLSYNILYEPSELDGITKIRITHRTEVDAKGCWELFGALLYHKGLAITTMAEDQGFHEVISMRGPRAREAATAARFVPHTEIDAYRQLRATPILTTMPLTHINANIATNALRPFFAAAGGAATLTFGTAGTNSAILLQGFGPQVAAACQLLQLVDSKTDADKNKIEVVRLRHASATDLVATVETVLTRHRQLQVAESGMPGAVGANLLILAQPSINAVILSGADAEVREAMELVALLDVPPAAGSEAASPPQQQRESVHALPTGGQTEQGSAPGRSR